MKKKKNCVRNFWEPKNINGVYLLKRQLKTSQVYSLFFRPLAQHYPGVGDSPLVYRSSPILAEESK